MAESRTALHAARIRVTAVGLYIIIAQVSGFSCNLRLGARDVRAISWECVGNTGLYRQGVPLALRLARQKKHHNNIRACTNPGKFIINCAVRDLTSTTHFLLFNVYTQSSKQRRFHH
jgi:hypothetical protein